MSDVKIEFIPFFIPPQNQNFSMAKVYNVSLSYPPTLIY